ncbi:GATA transcription factor 8 [Hibiscus syriacus]|uniref:GATA transcription factor n=1 Tax=Hibiscus syriacus TaxID=106335 RepID=A0A6A2X2S2_HIBSY|nr:GATA transcription factor 8-like [Hibiscus syriacus]KAE8669203.1 GATA transcription factor 8 [Hibiscus syriacus]
MIGPTDFIDEIDCGSFFDHIDELLDFPNDDVDAALSASDSAAFPSIWTAQSESFPCSDSVFSNNSASDLSAELSVPYEDIVQLEWLSHFVEDSNCGASLTIKKQEPSSINKESSDHQFQTSSPVSVLESSSSCSGEIKPLLEPASATGKRGRARSKRPRPATFSPRPAIQLISPSSSINDDGNDVPILIPKVSSDSESYAESRLLIKLSRQLNPEHKKKKKIKLTLPTPPTDNNAVPNQPGQPQAVRKCMHCEITKTPQWRAGPMGPKTLCNACGVRYKSGRLFPEYRPAASPTFIPSVHSNSHKKVLEMRTKIGSAGETTDPPEMIPNKSNPVLDYMQKQGLGFGEF